MDAIIDYRGKSPEKTTAGVPLVTAKIVKNGRILPPEEFIAEKDYQAWMRRGMPAAGDVVMTTEAPLGEVAQLDGRRVALAQRVITLRGKPHLVDNTFLKFLLQSEPVQEELRNRSTGTTVLGIRQSELRKVTLRLPLLPEQKCIAHILGTLDNKIELNRRMNTTLDGISRAIFKSWFVDFDPVRQKAAGKQPVGMDAQTAALFPDSFEDSEIGEVPKGWRPRSIYESAEVTYGAPFASSQFNDKGEGTPLIRIRDLTNESPDICTTEVHPKGYLVQPGDILVGMDGEFRAYVWGGQPGWLNQRVCVFKARDPYGSAFVREAITEPLRQVEATETATTVIHLGKGDIDCFRIVGPSSELVTRFGRLCQPVYEQIVGNKHQSRTLAALRDTLLPKLLSGEVRVPEAEDTVEDAIA